MSSMRSVGKGNGFHEINSEGKWALRVQWEGIYDVLACRCSARNKARLTGFPASILYICIISMILMLLYMLYPKRQWYRQLLYMKLGI